MKPFKLIPYRINDAVLMVSTYQEGAITGWLAHPRLTGPQPIRSLPQLLFLLDDILSQEDAPISQQAFDPIRTETPPCIATLRLQILFRGCNGCNVIVLHQEIQHARRNKSRQGGAEANILDA